MNIAKVSANGQITVPVAIRRLLQLGPGDTVLFTQNDDGDVLFAKANTGHADALKYASSERGYQQTAFGPSKQEHDAIAEIIAELNAPAAPRTEQAVDEGRKSEDEDRSER